MSVSDVVQNGADEGILLRERMTEAAGLAFVYIRSVICIRNHIRESRARARGITSSPMSPNGDGVLPRTAKDLVWESLDAHRFSERMLCHRNNPSREYKYFMS
ncbi:hypothetical protein XPA_001415 [Xanthoria parietina]